jgi:hypothetical protein
MMQFRVRILCSAVILGALPTLAAAQTSVDQLPSTAPTTEQAAEPFNLDTDQQGLPEEQATEQMAARATHGAVQVLDADGIRQTLIDAVRAVSSNDLAALGHHLAAGADIANLANAKQTLAPALSRLKRDFRRRYKEPLEFTTRPEAVINSHFFEIGNALDAAPALGNRDAATAIIRGSDDLDGAEIPMIRQNGQWLIEVRASDAKQLVQRLNQAVRWMDQHEENWPARSTAARREIAHAVLMAFAPVSANGAPVAPDQRRDGVGN